MIQLTKKGLTGRADIEFLQQQFEREHSFRLSGLLQADLLGTLMPRMDTLEWFTRDDGSIAREQSPTSSTLAHAINFAVNTPEFLEVIRQITQCEDILLFEGRLYRFAPGSEHFDSWHSDLGMSLRDRLVGMSINLGSVPYEGGEFRLRDKSSETVISELVNTGQGDAIFFRISSKLQHMVTAVRGSQPKTAFAGWFRSGETTFYETLRQTMSDGSGHESHGPEKSKS